MRMHGRVVSTLPLLPCYVDHNTWIMTLYSSGKQIFLLCITFKACWQPLIQKAALNSRLESLTDIHKRCPL